MYVSIVRYVKSPSSSNNVSQNQARHIVNFMRQIYLCEHPSDELDLLEGKFTDACAVVNTVSLKKYDNIHQLVALTIDFDNMMSLGYINYSEYKNNTLQMTHTQQLFLEDKQQRLIKRHQLTNYSLGCSNIEDTLKLIDKKDESIEPKRLIRQYDLNGNFIADFNSISEAAVSTGINDSNISKCCNHQQATAKGFIFRYSDDTTPVVSERKRNTFRSGKDPKKKRVSQYTLDGVLIKTFDSMGEAAEEVNGKQSNITAVCNGQRKSAYGFIWKYCAENSEE